MELSLAKPVVIRKPQLLKDYLLDDLSSCSSSGFRSYPRRQCCTSVRFLLEVDLKNKPPRYIKKPPQKSPLKPPSAFQRASAAVINTFKSSNKLKLTFLPRSLSRKLLKRSLWKKSDRKEIPPPSPPAMHIVKNSISHPPPQPPPQEFVISTASGDSSSSTSESNCKSKSNSWSDSEFTASSDICSGVNKNTTTATTDNSIVEISNKALEDDVVSVENNSDSEVSLAKDKAVSSSSKRVGVLVGGDDSSEATTTTTSDSSNTSTNLKQCPSPISSDVLEGMQCPSHEEVKQHFSPVSVLDCPFDDDDEVSVSSSPFQQRLAHMEGTKKKLLRKIKKFERLTELNPLNLEKRITALSESDHDSEQSSGYLLSESDCDSDRTSGYILSEYDGDSDRSPRRALSESDRSSNKSTHCVLSESDRDADSDRSPHCRSSESSSEDFNDSRENEENQARDRSFKLLQLVKSTMPSICNMKVRANCDKLLLDFFKEGMELRNKSPDNPISLCKNRKILDHDLVNAAKDWIMGQPRELYLGWEVPKNREAYMRDMERAGTWRKSNEEKQEVAMELEVEVFGTMMKELCHDLLSS